MTKRLHTHSKIFFNNPYVIRVDYSDGNIEFSEEHYRLLCRKTYKLMEGTWGHSPLMIEFIEEELDFRQTIRGYFIFKDNIDALQFRLYCDITNIKLFMWPSKLVFTIHEFVEDSTLQQAI